MIAFKFNLFSILVLTTVQLIAQTQNGIIDAPGDIAFVGYEHSATSSYAFVFIDDCPAGTVIIFDDEEWNGTGWNGSGTSEGANTWINDTGSTIPAGTVVTVDDADTNLPATPTVNIGSATESDSGFNLGEEDAIFAYVGTFRTTSVTFLAMVGDTDNPSPQTISGTGLILGTHTFDIDDLGGGINEGVYTGSTVCNGTALQCLQMINNSANWSLIGGSVTYPGSIPTAFTGSVLPVELISFQGHSAPDGIQLSWQTASEVNNAYFVLERSYDGVSYVELTKVEGQAISNNLKSYEYLDRNASSGTLYYRLFQVDYDDHKSQLKTIAVEFQQQIFDATIIPNPFQSTFRISSNPVSTENTFLRIFNASGILMFEQALSINQTDIQVQTHDWPNGVYSVQIIAPQEVLFQQIIKSH